MNWMSSRPSAFLSLLSLILLFTYSTARGDETVILSIILNQEKKGEYYLIMRDDGDFFIKVEDAKAIGFKDIEGSVYDIEGELYVLLSSIRGIEFNLNVMNLYLEITALPFHFSRQVFDLGRRHSESIRYPSDTSAFFNYSLQYTKDSSFDRIELFNEIGIRHGTWLFLTDSNFSKSDSEEDFVRLTTNLTHDRRQKLQRLIIGDFLAPVRNFSPSLNMAGIRFYKAYDIAPDLITHPLLNFSGSAVLPSELEVYLDGRPYYSKKLHPGDFDLINAFPREGRGLMEVIIRDPFGREERLEIPFYLTTALLRRGYHDYSYAMGFLREQFGIESNEYGDFVLSGFQFYGINDYMTTGLNAAMSRGRYNLGPAGSLKLWNAGILSLAMAVSENDAGELGYAEFVEYNYETQRFNMNGNLSAFSRDYAPIIRTASQTAPQFHSSIGFGYDVQTLGTFALRYEIIKNYEEGSLRAITARYSRILYHRLRMIAQARIIKGEDDTKEFLISLVYSPARRTTVSMSYSQEEDTNVETVQVDNAVPIGEGYGGRASYTRTHSETDSTNALDGFLQYNARYGTYMGRYQAIGSNSIYQVSAAGGIAYVARSLSFGRPVTDSFALVEVGDLEDVRVYVNNNEIGRTNSKGRLFVPDMASYYNNQVSIDDHDIPMDYTFLDVRQLVSPPGRSGSYIPFEVSKYRAIFGKIFIKTLGESQLLKLYQISMDVEGIPLTFQTTSDGEFYVENIYAGEYKASFVYKQKTCLFDIIVPETEENLIDVGELVCETTH